MSHLITVVLVVAACWFSVALVAGIALGTFMRRASALAMLHESAQYRGRRPMVSAPADSIPILHPAGIHAGGPDTGSDAHEPLS